MVLFVNKCLEYWVRDGEPNEATCFWRDAVSSRRAPSGQLVIIVKLDTLFVV